jgi:hypothetical protein
MWFAFLPYVLIHKLVRIRYVLTYSPEIIGPDALSFFTQLPSNIIDQVSLRASRPDHKAKLAIKIFNQHYLAVTGGISQSRYQNLYR